MIIARANIIVIKSVWIMKIVITIPKELSFAANSIACIGLAGTDAQILTCSLDITAKKITITNAVTF